MRAYSRLFIDGGWCSPSGGIIEIADSATEQVIGAVPEGTAADIDLAVAAARRALPAWSMQAPSHRAELLAALSKLLSSRGEEIAGVISREVGMPIKLAQRIQAALPALISGSYAKLLDSFEFETEIGNSRVVKTAKGIVGAVTPWNYPLHQLVAKVAPALAAGCTVVAKPSEEAPLSAFILAESIETAGFPAGVFNLVSGYGPTAGEALAIHDHVDMVSFTGSTATGGHLASLCGSKIRRITLELGGKSPSVILDDADLDAAIRGTVNNCFLNSGQTCTALTRIIVPRTRLGEVEERVNAIVAGVKVGDPSDPDVRLGPLVSARQRDRVRSYIERGLSEGQRLLVGGSHPPDCLDKGFFVRPTAFTSVDPDSTIAQEEIFGPVLTILTYDDEDEAVTIANGTRYGLAAAIWSTDVERALKVAKRVRAGQVDINGARFNPLAPFGGFKQSGWGRELGVYGLEEYLEPQAIQLP